MSILIFKMQNDTDDFFYNVAHILKKRRTKYSKYHKDLFNLKKS